MFYSKGNTEEGLDTVLEHHQNMQEKIAEEMIQMAQNLKHNSMVASNILKKDNKVKCISVVAEKLSELGGGGGGVYYKDYGINYMHTYI